ncbi:hypothetical protein GQ457_15G011540 [Hibiscus cannabinus]
MENCPLQKTSDPQPNQCDGAPVESPPAPHQPSETEAFGPWMIVARKQRRGPKKTAVVDNSPASAPQFHTRFDPIMNEGVEVQPPEIVEPLRPPRFVAKGKSVAANPTNASKPSKSVINVRRPLSISRNVPTSRLSNIASSFFTFPFVPLSTKPIDRGNHSVINISENDDPNVVHAPIHQDKGSRSLPPGDPPDVQGIPARTSLVGMDISQHDGSTLPSKLELLWRQKSCSDWIHLGDRNTSYFHRKATLRKVRNRISSLKIRDGSWCDDEGILKDEAVAYYKSLFSLDQHEVNPSTYHNSFPDIDSNSLSHLDSVPSPAEIRAALMDMAPLKAPGIDGLHAEFYQRNWDIVGPSICGTIRGVFSGGSLDPELNRTLLVLIPKVTSPESFAEFRPISLCSIIYKILTKVIVNRLKPLMPHLVSPTQSSFISGRSITDNIIINQEAIHSMRLSKAKNGWLAIKVDLEKAFDRSARYIPIPGWSAPSSPWVCLNTDGAACLHSSYAKAGGVIRDCNGFWIAGFGRGIGIADAFTAELWAIHDGLSLAWRLGFRFVQVQSDCLKVISELSDTSTAHGFSVLLRDILSLRQRNWVIQFLWVPRSANMVADSLLKRIPPTHFDMIHFDDPPDYIQTLFDHDMNSHHGLTDA